MKQLLITLTIGVLFGGCGGDMYEAKKNIIFTELCKDHYGVYSSTNLLALGYMVRCNDGTYRNKKHIDIDNYTGQDVYEEIKRRQSNENK